MNRFIPPAPSRSIEERASRTGRAGRVVLRSIRARSRLSRPVAFPPSDPCRERADDPFLFRQSRRLAGRPHPERAAKRFRYALECDAVASCRAVPSVATPCSRSARPALRGLDGRDHRSRLDRSSERTACPEWTRGGCGTGEGEWAARDSLSVTAAPLYIIDIIGSYKSAHPDRCGEPLVSGFPGTGPEIRTGRFVTSENVSLKPNGSHDAMWTGPQVRPRIGPADSGLPGMCRLDWMAGTRQGRPGPKASRRADGPGRDLRLVVAANGGTVTERLARGGCLSLGVPS